MLPSTFNGSVSMNIGGVSQADYDLYPPDLRRGIEDVSVPEGADFPVTLSLWEDLSDELKAVIPQPEKGSVSVVPMTRDLRSFAERKGPVVDTIVDQLDEFRLHVNELVRGYFTQSGGLSITLAHRYLERKGVTNVDRDMAERLVRLAVEKKSFEVRLALSELFPNHIRHGHKCDPRKTLMAMANVTGSKLRLVTTDDGPGFDHTNLPEPDFITGKGRGVFLMRGFMNSVEFRDGGRTCEMEKDLTTIVPPSWDAVFDEIEGFDPSETPAS